MIVLDTQVVSQLQRGSKDVARLDAKLVSLADLDVRITAITPFEQMRNRLGKIKLDRRDLEADMGNLAFLLELTRYYAVHWAGRILPLDRPAVSAFRAIPPKVLQKAGVRDACIAAIALASGATVLTENIRHFEIIPGLSVDRW